MKNVRSIHVDHDARVRIALGMAVARDMTSWLEDFDRMTHESQLTGDDRAGEARTCNTNMRH